MPIILIPESPDEAVVNISIYSVYSNVSLILFENTYYGHKGLCYQVST